MARLRRHRALILSLLLALTPLQTLAQEAASGLYDRPVLAIDPGVHTAPIKRADVDRNGEIAVTGSDDGTVRVWSLADGRLMRTIRAPQGPGHIGKIYSVAIDPDGEVIAAGGWTRWSEGDPQEQIYLFDAATGEMLERIDGLPGAVYHLAFSRDGRQLAATLQSGYGLRVYDRARGWEEVARDADYGDHSYGADFASDGRLVTTSYDGRLRLYDPDGILLASRYTDGQRPFGVAFDGKGDRIAVGFWESTDVRLYDGRTLAPVGVQPDAGDIEGGDLLAVAWSADGETLYAGGQYQGFIDGAWTTPIIAWPALGSGDRRVLPAASDTIMSLKALPDGDLLVVAADPWLGRLAPQGAPRWPPVTPAQMDPRNQERTFSVSDDGMRVDFGYEFLGGRPARFDVATLLLTADPPKDSLTRPPEQQALDIDWSRTLKPMLADSPLTVYDDEMSFSLAIHPDAKRFVLGTQWNLRAFDDSGAELWRKDIPGVAWAVNISGDGRFVVAAYGDGTIRWHRMEDGKELLALFPIDDGTHRWVVWTPEGYFAASDGADEVLGWHVNRGWDEAAEFFPVSAISGFNRPDVIRNVLREGETARALGLAALEEHRLRVQQFVGSAEPPGAQLHVLTIGISDYKNDEGLTLKYADDDARDLAETLLAQRGPLYADVKVTYLPNEQASRRAILRALRALRSQVVAEQNDVAVILFSGHGEVANGHYYLLPWDVEVDDDIAIEDTALRIDVLRETVEEIGRSAKVLVLIDSCHSGTSVDGAAYLTDVRESLARSGSGVVVMTSSSGAEISLEKEELENGVFTEALIEAFGSGRADRGDGWLTASELQDYVFRRVQELTNDGQTPQISAGGQNFFNAELFTAARQ